MSKYSGNPVTIPINIAELYKKIDNVDGYHELLEKVPEEMQGKLRGLTIEDGKITIDSPGVGKVELVKEVSEPCNHVSFKALNAPVPISLCLDLEKKSDEETILTPSIDAELPTMLKPFLSARLQEGSTMLGKAFSHMFSR